MSFKTMGEQVNDFSEFLNLDSHENLLQFRNQYKDEYNMIYELVQFLGEIANSLTKVNSSQRNIMLISSVLELNRLFQSAVILLEKGISSSAKVVTRTILELSLKIIETVKNEDYVNESIQNEIEEAFSTLKVAEKYGKIDLIPLETRQEIQNAKKQIGKKKDTRISLKQIAEKNDMLVEYLLYRTYCSNTHISASALADNFKSTSNGVVFQYGIKCDNFKIDLRMLISIVMISLPVLANEYLKNDNMKEQYEVMCSKFYSIFNYSV